MRCKKPMISRLNLYDMDARLDEISEQIEEVEWCGDTKGGIREAFTELVGDEDEAVKYARERMKRFTKDELIRQAHKAFLIAMSFLQLEGRYDRLEGALELLRGTYGSQLDVINEVCEEYEKQMKLEGYERHWYKFDRIVKELPDQAWLE